MSAAPDAAPRADKEPFDIHEVFRRLRRVCAPWPKAAMFELRDRGYAGPFEQLVASLISARTLDETTIPVCLRLFARARTPEAMAELPEEEVISRLLFDRGLDNLSPLQAAQLASAVAELAGRGGEGIVSRLRNSFGLDDLDVTTGEDGSAAVRAGKYLSEKVYTDVTIGSEGKTEINLNLDVRPGVTARGTLGSDGSTGIGIYYEKDY